MNSGPDRWFPLVPRQRPPAEQIQTRVDRVLREAQLARANAPEAEVALARAFNGAALIASDAHLPDLARAWCWQHAELYLDDLPLTSDRAIRALEPVVNLARLDIRAGRPGEALEILDRLLQGLREGTAVRVQDRVLPLDRIARTMNERVEVHRWAWSVYLGDGMRALAAQGRWQDATERAYQIGGVGQRLFDGRQVTVMARLTAGETGQAMRLVEESEVYEPWERCVQLLLRLRCRHVSEEVEELIETIRTLETPLLATRAGLTGLHLMKHGQPSAEELLDQVVKNAMKDGYAARDLLADASAALAETDLKYLSTVCTEAGLGPKNCPEVLLSQLTQALRTLRPEL